MSAISNKSKLVLFLMVVISLAFLITSFLTAALTNDSSFSARNAQSQSGVASPAGPSSSGIPAGSESSSGISRGDCIIVKTVDGKIFGECSHPY